MTYKNSDSTVLKSAKISTLAIGTQVVFYNDGSLEDIHVIQGVTEENSVIGNKGRMKTTVKVNTQLEYPFTQDIDRVVFVLKAAPTRQDLLFDESDNY